MDKNQRVKSVKNYLNGLVKGLDKKKLLEDYEKDFEGMKSEEVFEAFTVALNEGLSIEDIMLVLNKAIKIFALYLEPFDKNNLPRGHFIELLCRENEKIKIKLNESKLVIALRDNIKTKKELFKVYDLVLEYEAHLIKKENILFAYMERKNKIFDGLSIMWEVHDLIRNWTRKFKNTNKNEFDVDEMNKLLGEIYFLLFGLIEKEELFLFPTAIRLFSKKDFDEMKNQSLDYNFSFISEDDDIKEFIKTSQQRSKFENSEVESSTSDLIYKSDTGNLSFEQLRAIFEVLPVDISFVDENNKFMFFSDSGGRIFPRSKASIGRDVEKCHPPKSYHMVEKIITSFKNNEENEAKFWINLRGRKILISYFALRNKKGDYKGVLEISQDITDLTQIKGEKKLLDF